MNELLGQFSHRRQTLLATLEGLPSDRTGELAFGEWDLQCVIAHLSAWDRYFAEMVKLLRAEAEIPYWGDIDKFNEMSVEKCKAWTWDRVYDEFVQAGQAFIDAYSHLEQALWETRFWPQGTVTPLQIVEINIHHYETHREKIKKEMGE